MAAAAAAGASAPMPGLLESGRVVVKIQLEGARKGTLVCLMDPKDKLKERVSSVAADASPTKWENAFYADECRIVVAEESTSVAADRVAEELVVHGDLSAREALSVRDRLYPACAGRVLEVRVAVREGMRLSSYSGGRD